MTKVKESEPQIARNPFPTLHVHGGGTGWYIRYIDAEMRYAKKPHDEHFYSAKFILTELASRRFECKDDAEMYMQTLELLRHTGGAYLVFDDIIEYVFTAVHKETFDLVTEEVS